MLLTGYMSLQFSRLLEQELCFCTDIYNKRHSTTANELCWTPVSIVKPICKQPSRRSENVRSLQAIILTIEYFVLLTVTGGPG